MRNRAKWKMFCIYPSLILAEYENLLMIGGYFFKIFFRNFRKSRFYWKKLFGKLFMRTCSSTSPTGGNQVDCLPPVHPASHSFQTGGKRQPDFRWWRLVELCVLIFCEVCFFFTNMKFQIFKNIMTSDIFL